ncbi:GNAT family N-acetyltransferase [Roseomonas marmotae]|uniref:GNAT family N-acetyltransferase n=1 Tax=Roseomonas marmotae TaxID=2768161 RepID=A0ABS3K9A4_9PROT|nr:GNAT family N-acetyltransferase [Roseomonas marmotae]MBO1074054.1 GNAT family N-acetyltransferase [Roseomonas marmotae]QTI78840.1 GNAT family N-acetyltransferase [Roseomonas marmotae]
MQGLTIREAAPSDREALIDLFGLLNGFEGAIAGDRALGRGAAEASLDHSDRRVTESDGHRLVALHDGAVLGLLFLAFPRQPPYVREALRPHGFVTELVVRPEARGTGIGRTLLAEAERLTRARGLNRLMLGVLAGNERAERTYRQAGFAPYALEMLKRLD